MLAIVQNWTLEGMLIAAVIIAAAVALVLIGVRAMGIQIPPWVVQVFWIVVIAVVVVFAIKFVFSL
jgi:hypothetical protein